MKTLNLNRAPFLSSALNYIRQHPGCCKRDAILGVGYRYTQQGRITNDTYSYRNAALSRLIIAGYVRNKASGCRYELEAIS